MRLTVLGCAGSYPGPESPASGYLLEAPFEGRTYRLVMDLGNGALSTLQRCVALEDVDAVVLSHLHPDHCLDMCGFYVARKYAPGGSLRQIPVHAPSGTADFLAGAYGLDDDEGMTGVFDFRVWDPSLPVRLGPFDVAVAAVDHPIEAYGLRVEHDGAVLAYSGDTGPTPALDELVRGADAFLCEASFVESQDNPPNLHLTGAEAGRYTADNAVGRLLLTHVPAWTDPAEVLRDAKTTWDGPTDLVHVGASYDL